MIGLIFFGLANRYYSVNINPIAMTYGVKVKKLLGVVSLFVTTCLLVGMGPATAFAAPSAANGYRLSPVRTDLNIDRGSSDTVTVYIQNASSAVENLQVVINDFEAPTNETGYPSLLLNGSQAPTHSLKQFATALNPTFTLQPNQQEPVNVLINIPTNAVSGGYYGAIRFFPAGSPGTKNVNLSASIASLVLVTVPGNLKEQVSIVGFGVSQGSSTVTHSFFLSNKNLQAITRFKNSGNVQEQPFGKIQLKQGSTVLNTYGVNNSASPGNVLPDSIRLFSVSINKVGWYGKYKIEGNFGYGSKGQLLSATSTFYVIPILFIILAVLLILLIVFLIFGLPRFIRAYNRRVVARANRQR
jgi:hypothetical protein